MTEATFQQLEARLTPARQQHLLAGWTSLDREQKERLAAQIQGLDLDLYQALLADDDLAQPFDSSQARPAQAIRLNSSLPHALSGCDRRHARSTGEAALADRRVAMVLVAGGKGTRLGRDGPKGTLPIGPVSERSLLHMAVDQLLAVQHRHAAPIPLLVMTSPEVHAETVDFFRRHDYFGLQQSQCQLFCQDVLPALDAESGQILLSTPGQLLTAPDGHGGVVGALKRCGQLDRLAEHGVDTLFYAQVDNPLVQVCQAELIGHHLANESEMTTQVVEKAHSLERAGTLVLQNGIPRVVEYSELPEELAQATESDGRLRYWAGSIAVHVLSLDFLRRASEKPAWLPFHHARKQAQCLTPGDEAAGPAERTVIQFERFVFDLLLHASNPLLVEVDRAAAFAPVKNPNSVGEDTPATARAAISALHRSWLVQAGVQVDNEVTVEIHPSWARSAEEVKRRPDLPQSIGESTFLSGETPGETSR